LRCSLTGLQTINSALQELGLKTLKDDFPGKTVGRSAEKIFKAICEESGVRESKMKKIQNAFEKSITEETPPGLRGMMRDLKEADVLVALITNNYDGLDKNLEKIGLDKKLFNFIQIQTEKRGSEDYLKKVITWAEGKSIEKDEIIFVGNRAADYLSILSMKTEIGFLGVMSGTKADHFSKMGLSKENIVPFWSLVDKLVSIVYGEAEA